MHDWFCWIFMFFFFLVKRDHFSLLHIYTQMFNINVYTEGNFMVKFSYRKLLQEELTCSYFDTKMSQF